MIHIVITAGGTEEPIDGIRKITNISSGSLGWHCFEAVLNYMSEENYKDFKVHYIKTPSAFSKSLNSSENIEFINVSNTQSVYDSVKEILLEHKIDIFIHAMAISDFAYSYSIGVDDLAKELHQAIIDNPELDTEGIFKILKDPQNRYDGDSKISSRKDIMMGLKTTPKVIPLIKHLSPQTFLVGFKLIKNHTGNKLFEEAEKLRINNECDAVFANEAADLSEKNHKGILFHRGVIVSEPRGKNDIAKAIVDLAFNETLKK